MHYLAIVLLAAAGISYCASAIARWRRLATPGEGGGHLWLVWVGLALHTVGLVVSFADRANPDFTYGVLGVWAAVASLFFLQRFLVMPSRWLLVLPLGGMAILLAMAALAGGALPHAQTANQKMPLIVTVHIIFMATHLAASLLAGAAGGLYLLAGRQLKSAKPSAFKLPNLPLLENLTERGLIVATALLIGGLATGGAAIQLSPGFSLMHPTALLGLVNMTLMIVALGARAANRFGRRAVAWAAIACLLINACVSVSQLVVRHG
jgi:hypothetical protein